MPIVKSDLRLHVRTAVHRAGQKVEQKVERKAERRADYKENSQAQALRGVPAAGFLGVWWCDAGRVGIVAEVGGLHCFISVTGGVEWLQLISSVT